MAALQRLEQGLQQTSQAVQRGFDQMAGATRRSTEQMTASIDKMAQSSLQAFQTISQAAASVFAAFQVSGFLRDVTMTAARTETLGVVMTQVAKNAGITSQQVNQLRDGIKAIGITTQESSLIVTRFIQNNLDLSKAVDLARVAQNAAVIANQNTSEALAGLVHGIVTLQPEVLRSYSAFVNLEQAYQTVAKASGRTVEQLSVQEKQQIALNAVLEQGKSIAGTYGASMETVGKLLGSLNRVLEESANIMGSQYLPVLKLLVEGVTLALQGYQALPAPIQTATAAMAAATIVVGGLTVAIAGLTKAAQVLAISSLFTGWGPVIIAIGAATAAVIGLIKYLNDLGRTDPDAVRQRSISAIESRIQQTRQLLEIQERANKAAEGSMAGSQLTEQQVARTNQLRASLEGLQKVREQLANPPAQPIVQKTAVEDWTQRQIDALGKAQGIPAQLNKQIADIDRTLRAARSNVPAFEEALGLFRADPQFEAKRAAFIQRQEQARQELQDKLLNIDRKGAEKAAREAEQARINAIQEGLKRQEALIAQSFADRRAQEEEALAERIRAAPGEAEQIRQAHRETMRGIAQEEATQLEQVRLDANTRLLAADQTYADQREAILAKSAETRRKLTKEATDDEINELIRANELLEKVREQGLQDFAKQTQSRAEEIARAEDRVLESQARSYENFVDRVATTIEDIFQGVMNGTLDAVDFFKSLLTKALSTILSSVVAPFIASLGAQVAGGLATMLPRGLGDLLVNAVGVPAAAQEGGILDLLGLTTVGTQLANLFGPTGSVGLAFTRFTSMLDRGAAAIGGSIADVFGLTNLPASGLMALGGAAGIGGGIFSAVNARGLGGMAGGAIGAAGGAAALAAGLGLGLNPIFAPIGLALAALAPLLGNLIDSLGAPKGPRFALGGIGGLGIGAGPGGLTLQGAVTSRVGRAERIPGGIDTGAIQQQLAEGITAMVQGMVNAINTVALQPNVLLGETQQALSDAMASVRTINSSNKKKFEADINAQVRFTAVNIASFFLDPLNQAAEQLLEADLATQVERFAPTMGALADTFRLMLDKVTEVADTANTDVLRQISGLRGRVENFGHQIVEVATQLATEIVDGVAAKGQQAVQAVLAQPIDIQPLTVAGAFAERLQAAEALRRGQEALGARGLEFSGVQQQLERLFTTVITDAFAVIDQALATAPFDKALQVILAIPDAVIGLNPALAQMRALAQAFAPVVNALSQDIATLEEAITPLSQRIGQSHQRMQDLQASFEANHRNIGVALSLYDELRQEVLRNTELQIEQIRAIQQAWESAMSGIEDRITELETELLPFSVQVDKANTSLAQAADNFQRLAASGDTLAAVQAAEAYGRAIRDNAEIQREAVRREKQARLEAQQAVIDSIQARIDAEEAQMEVTRDQIEAWEDQMDLTREQIEAWDEAARAQEKVIDGLRDEVQAREETVDSLRREVESLRGLRERVGELVRGGQAPARQAEAIRAELRAEQAALAGATGEDAIRHLERLVALNEELKGLGEQTDHLVLIKEALDNLAVLQGELNQRQAGADQHLSVAEQHLATAQQQLAQEEATLAAINQEIEHLNDILAAQQQQVDALNKVLALQQKRVDRLNEELAAAQAVKQAIDEDKAWTQAIAAINQAELAALYDLRAWLIAIQGGVSWDQHIFNIQNAALGTLNAMHQALSLLYGSAATSAAWAPHLYAAASQSLDAQRHMSGQLGAVIENTRRPVDVKVGNFYEAPRQRGGLIGAASGLYYAQGGLVPALLEPGELVMSGRMSRAQMGALSAVNEAFPRFAGGGWLVPGSGDGDRVPAFLASGSFVMNRNATRAMGFQRGGRVSRGSAAVMEDEPERRPIVNHFDMRGVQFATPQVAKEVVRILDDWAKKRGYSGLR